MIIFLYGPDTYRSQQKLNKIAGNYKKIHKTGLNFSTIDFKESDFDNFKQIIESCSIFKEKKLIVFKNLFSSDENTIQRLSDYLEKSNLAFSREEIIIIYEKDCLHPEFKGIKKTLFEKLIKRAKFQEFKLLEGPELKNWIKKEFSDKNIQINSEALEKIIFYVGNDLWRMSNEIQKLILFKNGKEKIIGEKDIDLLVRPRIDANIFKTIDAVANKNKKLALQLINEHIENGETGGYILSMILWQIRNLVKVKTLSQSLNKIQIQRKDRMAKKLKLHPYVVEKTLKESLKFTMEELKKIYQKILEVDYKMKTGKIKPKTAINLFIAEIC